jgi:hypothetical protein
MAIAIILTDVGRGKGRRDFVDGTHAVNAAIF